MNCTGFLEVHREIRSGRPGALAVETSVAAASESIIMRALLFTSERFPCQHLPAVPYHIRTASPARCTCVTRREFLHRTAALAGAACLAPGVLAAANSPQDTAVAEQVRTAVDQVPLGDTGLQLSRLGFGTGSHSGNVQKALGQQAFNDLIRCAFDRGITYFDCAQSYATFDWMGGAIKGLPARNCSCNRRFPASRRMC